MSATNRGTVRDEKDFYATPRAAFAPLLDILPPTLPPDCADNLSGYYEPCAGDGRIIRWLRESGRHADGADLFPQFSHHAYPLTPVDYLKDETPRQFVLTNPPFGIAFEMCQHAKKHAREFMFLLRLSFLESDERGEWLSANEPSALFVLKKRPSFVMACRCSKASIRDDGNPYTRGCKHSWILPIEAERPKVCPKCGDTQAISISTSDNSGYAWFYWGNRFQGIRHI